MNSVPTIRRFLVGAGLVVSAIAGQLLLREGYSLAGGGALLLCAGGFAWVFRDATLPAATLDLRGHVSMSRSDWSVAAALTASACLVLLALFLLDVREPSASFWRVYLLSIGAILLIPLGIVFVQRIRDAGWGSRSSWLLLILILGLAVSTRLIALSSLPFGTWYDEAANGLESLRIINEPQYRPVYTDGVNASGHYLYLVVAAFKLFGVQTQSVRLVSAIAGIATVGAAYFAGRELFGRSSGFLLAFMVAVSRWAINFSRLGMYNAFTPLFELLTIAFLARALRRNRLADYALAGLSLGLGFCFYAAFQLFAAAIALFLAYVVAVRWRPDSRFWIGLAVTVASALVVVAPIIAYAAERPDSYFARVQNTSLLADKEAGERVPALARNVRKHLLMFNVRGDPNGRHNLPGEPMLAPTVAALFVIGVALSLARLRQPYSLLFLAWFAFGLLGGVLSLDFEAPQSLRSIAALPAVYVLAVMPLILLNGEWRAGGGRYLPSAAPVMLGLLLLPSALYNLNTYFVRQAQGFASWNAFSTPETITAGYLNSLDPNVSAYVISLYNNHPTVRFLTQDVEPYVRLETTASLPIADSSDGDLVMILDAERRDLYEDALRIYPNAIHEAVVPPFGGPVVLYYVQIPYAERRRVQGFTGKYAAETDSSLPVVRRDAKIDFVWPEDAPVAAPFSVEWNGVLVAESYGPYQFGLEAPAASTLYLNETPVAALENGGNESGNVILPRGRHQIRIVAKSGDGIMRLRWRSPDRETEVLPEWVVYGEPVTNNGLLGEYFANGDWSGRPVLEQIDRGFDMYFHIPALPRPYTVAWTGKIAIPETGAYRFALESNDESTLLINGDEVAASPGGGVHVEGSVALREGFHDIEVRYADRSDHTFLTIYWSPPNTGGLLQVIPDDVLLPPRGSYERVSMPTLAQLNQTAAADSPGGQLAVAIPVEAEVIATGLDQPAGLAVLEGKSFVALPNRGAVVLLDEEGEVLLELIRPEWDLQEPFDVGVDDLGTLYVLDATAGTVSMFDAEGAPAGVLSIDPSYVRRARGIGFDGRGGLWIANTAGGNAVRYEMASGTLSSLPLREHMAAYGEAQPVDVVGTDDAAIYVTDAGVHKLSSYAYDSMRLWSTDIPVANTMHGSHLAAGSDGAVYMTEPEKGAVARITEGGDFGQRWILTTADGSFVKPLGIDVDDVGRVWVTDVAGGRVLRFTPGVASEASQEGQ